MRGSKPAEGSVARVSKQATRSLSRVSRRGGRRDTGFEQHDFLDDVRRVREDSRGDDASEVVREVVRRVEAAVLGAVAPALPAGGTAGKAKRPHRARKPHEQSRAVVGRSVMLGLARSRSVSLGLARTVEATRCVRADLAGDVFGVGGAL
jgi:hypothetical protein